MRLRHTCLGFLLVLLAASALGASAARAGTASHTDLWYSDRLNQIVSDIAGFPVEADGEDDMAEWTSFVAPDDPAAVLGFSYPFAPSTSLLYHRIFLAPSIWATLKQVLDSSLTTVAGTAADDAATAVLAVTHETYHLRMSSGDEGRVNACAYQAFSSVITTEFAVAPTIDQSVTVTVTKQVRVAYKKKVKVHGRWVVRTAYKLVPRTTYESRVQTVPNPAFAALVTAAQTFYAEQPPEYNTGTCS